MGCVYRMKNSPYFWIKWTATDGRPQYESSRSTNKTEAKNLLKKREGKVADGEPITAKIGRLTFAEAAEDLVNDYKANRRKSLDELQRRIDKHLRPFFTAARRMASIGAADVRKYIAHRRAATEIVTKAYDLKRPDGRVIRIRERRRKITAVSNAEINRELTVLRRMFALAVESERLLHAPHITELQEDNTRAGFFEPEQYRAVLAHLPVALRPVIAFAYITGWRIDSEVLPLQWRQVDFSAGTVRLEPGTTKNKAGRMFPMTADLRRVLITQWTEHETLRKAGTITPYVFVRMVAKGRGGDKSPKRITSFAKAWKTACTAAGCPGRIPHDCRRTAVRNLERAGVSRSAAMKATGHKTESVYRRYAIVSDGDLMEIAGKLDALAGAPGAVSSGQ